MAKKKSCYILRKKKNEIKLTFGKVHQPKEIRLKTNKEIADEKSETVTGKKEKKNDFISVRFNEKKATMTASFTFFFWNICFG